MNTITVAAAIIMNEQHEILLVRKKNTEFFMQVGGKLELNEAPEQAIVREIEEEIGCKAQIQQYVGRFETAAANEPDHALVSYMYYVTLDRVPQVYAEIAEMRWVALNDSEIPLGPLTKEVVIPWIQRYMAA